MSGAVIVYSYLRMSSIAQIQGDSERRQLKDAKDYADQNGYTLAPPFKDLGISAFKGNNRKKGALKVLLDGWKDGTLAKGILCIEAVDRLSREPPMRGMSVFQDILEAGVPIYVCNLRMTITEQTLNENSGILLILAAACGTAYQESRQKSERIEAAYRNRQELARQGRLLKGNYHPAWIRHEYLDCEVLGPRNRVVHHVIPEHAATVRRVFELAATGMGHHSISRTLNAEGAPVVPACLGSTPEARERAKRRRWFQAYVGRLLLDERVLGTYQPKKMVDGKSTPIGEPIPGHFPAIVGQELWNRVRDAANPKHGRKTGGRKLRFANLLTTLARCDTCGSNMLLHGNYPREGGATRQYLRCACNQQGWRCENTKMPRYEWLEAKILSALPGVPWRDLIRDVPADEATARVSEQIEQIETQLTDRKRASARLLRFIESEDTPDAEVLDRRREVQAEIAKLTKRRDVLAIDRDALRRNAAGDVGLVDEAVELAKLMATDDEVERFTIRQKLHAVLKRVIETVRCSEHGWAMVHIRGGLCLRVPYEKEGQVEAGFVAGGFNDFMGQRADRGLVPLAPDAEGRRLVQAFEASGYGPATSSPAPWSRTAA